MTVNYLFLLPATALFAVSVRRMPQSFFPAVSLFVFLIWQGCSVAYLESGTYSFELFTNTYQTGATFRLGMAIAALFGGYWAGFELLRIRVPAPAVGAAQGNRLLLALYIGMLLAAALALYPDMPPGNAIQSRNLFLASTESPSRDFIFKYLSVMALGAGLAATLSANRALINAAYLSVLANIFMLTQFGHKFSGIVSVLFPFCIPVAAIVLDRFRDRAYVRSQMLRMAALMLFSALLSVSAFSKYLKIRQAGWQDMRPNLEFASRGAITWDYIKQRLLVLQGGLWWITDRNFVRNGQRYTGEELFSYAGSMGHKTLAPANAYITEKAIGREKTKYLLDRYIQYASPSPAVFYAVGGRLAPPFFFAFSGLLLGLLSFYLVRKILLAQPLRAVLAFSLYLPVYNFILGGEFTSISPKHLALKLALLLAMENWRTVNEWLTGKAL